MAFVLESSSQSSAPLMGSFFSPIMLRRSPQLLDRETRHFSSHIHLEGAQRHEQTLQSGATKFHPVYWLISQFWHLRPKRGEQDRVLNVGMCVGQ